MNQLPVLFALHAGDAIDQILKLSVNSLFISRVFPSEHRQVTEAV